MIKRLLTGLIFTISAVFFLSVQPVSAQKKPTGKAKTAAKNIWAGVWNYAGRFTPGNLIIKPLSADKFKFEIEASNGANSGSIAGTAKIKGTKAVYDDRLSTAKNAEKLGCVMTFTHKGTLIDVDQTSECDGYAGNAVSFAGEYGKGKAKPVKDNFVTLKVFPDAQLDGKFKSLVGVKEYNVFLGDFQLISEDENSDDFTAKVYSACVRGICPYNAGIIMYDENRNIWAAVMNIEDPKKSFVHYYTNAPDWTEKMPKTIENWVKDKSELNDNLTVIYKNKKQ